MVLTLQKKCDPALIEGRYCWGTCCRSLEWNPLGGWSHSVADSSRNGHICISCVRRQNTETSTRERANTSCKTLLYIVLYQSLHSLHSTMRTIKAQRLELKRRGYKNCVELSQPDRCDGGAAGRAAGINIRAARCRAEANTGKEWGRKRLRRGGCAGQAWLKVSESF